ncbi:MAG: hypothetical protein ACE5HE_12795 [Phycisphaerae bacterium]
MFIAEDLTGSDFTHRKKVRGLAAWRPDGAARRSERAGGNLDGFVAHWRFPGHPQR